MGAKNYNTNRAKVQLQLDKFRDQITKWYLDEKKTATDIQELLLREHSIELTIGQTNFVIYRFDLKRDRNTSSIRHLEAIRNREYPIKNCKHCKEEYEPTSNRQTYCTECVTNGSDVRRIKNYGVCRRKLKLMFRAQNGKCDICEQDVNEDVIAVDHDHKTGVIRGLLCRPCNLRLCVVEDSTFTTRAQVYLEKHKQ